MPSNEELVDLTITYALLLGGEFEELEPIRPRWRVYNSDRTDWRQGETKYLAAARYIEGCCGYVLQCNGTLMKCKHSP